jgi:lipopolysaccharide transport system ATP-binding protein
MMTHSSEPTTPGAQAGAPAISVRGVNKVYHIYARPQDRLKQSLLRWKRYYREFWALRDVDVAIGRGETVGIVGRNGSGKSTLLQIICGTLQPSGGELAVQGRISALLELGSGFNPDFTGRENVYLNASILGLNKVETDAIYDDVLAFADIGDYVDQPTKTYSSGMVVRLAFAVAINVRPDILIVDEALAVGDEAFQRRCLSRLDAIRAAGATVVFVSHSSAQVMSLCDRVVVLDHGEKLFDGPPRLGINCYHKLLYMPADKVPEYRQRLKDGRAVEADEDSAAGPPASDQLAEAERQEAEETALLRGDQPYWDPAVVPKSTVSYESRGALIDEVRITTESGQRVNMLTRGGVFEVRCRIRLEREAFAAATGTLIKTLEGVELAGGTTYETDDVIDHLPAGSELEVCHRFVCRFTRGSYFINCGISGIIDGERHWLHRISDAAMFQVIPNQSGHSKGPVDLGFRTTVTVTAPA